MKYIYLYKAVAPDTSVYIKMGGLSTIKTHETSNIFSYMVAAEVCIDLLDPLTLSRMYVAKSAYL